MNNEFAKVANELHRLGGVCAQRNVAIAKPLLTYIQLMRLPGKFEEPRDLHPSESHTTNFSSSDTDASGTTVTEGDSCPVPSTSFSHLKDSAHPHWSSSSPLHHAVLYQQQLRWLEHDARARTSGVE